MRRQRYEEATFRETIAYLHGRIERELEAFADSLNCPRVELTARVGALLLGIRPGYGDSVSDVPVGTGSGGAGTPEVEGPSEPHGRESRKRRSTAPGHKTLTPRARQVKTYWERMSPEERQAEMKRRQRKWSPEAKAKWRKKTPAHA